MKVEELKEQARRHEQREEWQKAFDLYTTALGSQSEDEAPDIALLNRVGDIQTRLGQIDGAVGHYEQAIELYLEAELPNNAIAICKKVLRNLPDRNVFFLRMGQIRASQGFLTDARQNFLEYAERQTALGEVESALDALIEFVEFSPEDVEIRQGLAAQLESHERTEEAIQQYKEVYRRFSLLGRDEDAAEIVEKLGELDPESHLIDPDAIRAEEVSEEPEELVVETTSLGGLEVGDWTQEAGRDGIGVEFSEPSATAESEKMERPKEEDLEELPTFDFDAEEMAEDVEVLKSFPSEGTELDELEGKTAAEEPSGAEDLLPLIHFEDEVEEDEESPEPFPLVSIEESGEEAAAAAESTFVEEEGLPLLGMDDESDESELETAVETAVEEAVFESGKIETDLAELESVPDAELELAEPEAEPEEIHGEPELPDFQEAADRGDLESAIEGVRVHILARPDDIQLHQRLVEYAFRKNDQRALVSAYLELAGCLARTGASNKARAVYQQVLSLSPGQEEATAGLQELDGTAPAAPPSHVASSEEYVDLGAMILGDDGEETTRWTVPADAPSGDEEADFAKMLGQFKEKVSEHVAADDVGAHHDLGTAYMEMGLFEEAIGEFQMALRASPSHLPTHEVMGRCWMEMGKPEMAVRALTRALTVDYEIEDELIGIYYLMGRAQEEQGNNAEALDFYDKVFSLDINFEDVTERLRALR
ncbi:MAG: tetratricopeptide repeat protein [Gemmatimonadota bacterium]|jgi:tetratricopeptide (TPR) repeat protein